jgi:hypothetical protein
MAPLWGNKKARKEGLVSKGQEHTIFIALSLDTMFSVGPSGCFSWENYMLPDGRGNHPITKVSNSSILKSRENIEFFDIFFKENSDNRLMTVTGLTIQEIADRLGIPYKTAHKRLETAGIKPILKEDLYPESALETIRDIRMGRPPKAKPEAPAKTKKKPNK